jgi:hypothetical protein
MSTNVVPGIERRTFARGREAIMKKMVLSLTVSMLALLSFVSKSSVVEAQTSLGTFVITVRGSSRTTTVVDTFSEVTNAPAGGWAVDITKDVDATSPLLAQLLASDETVTSARVTIAGVTRRFQNGKIVNIQPMAAVVPREKVSITFATSN